MRFICKYNYISIAKFSSRSSFEANPPYMFDKKGFADPKLIKYPYHSEKVKQAMYQLFVDGPEKNSISALAQKYFTSIERITAIIYLMEQRQLAMKSLEIPDKIPDTWQNAYKLSKSNPTLSDEAIAEQTGIEVEAVKKVKTNLSHHFNRLANVKKNDLRLQIIAGRLSKSGVDSSFRETKTESHANKRLLSNYFPSLIQDEEFEYEKESLLKKVEAETKGSRTADLAFHLSTYEREQNGSKQVPVIDIAASIVNKAAGGDKSPSSQTSRWKYAVTELKGTREKHRAKEVKPTGQVELDDRHHASHPDDPSQPVPTEGTSAPPSLRTLRHGETVIRTRTGSFRKMTPLERMSRSFNPKISEVELKVASNVKILASQNYYDPDGDDDLLMIKRDLKKEKNKLRFAKKK